MQHRTSVSRPLRSRSFIARAATGLALSGLLLGLTACGGQSLSDDNTDAKGEGSSALAAISSEEKAKDVLESIKVDEKLAAEVSDEMKKTGIRATISVGYPPMEEWATNGTDVVGVDPALAHAIARKLGLPITIQDQEFNAMIPGLMSGRYDMLLSSMTDNAERRETTTFVDYVQAGNAFLVVKGNPEKVQLPADLCGKSVAVVESGSSALLAEDFSKQCTDAGKDAYNILKLAGDAEANLAVQSGRAVATITDYPVAVERASEKGAEVEAVRIDGDESIWGIGIDNSRKDFAELVQKTLQSLMDDGSYAKILDAWGLGDMALPKATINAGA